MSVKYKRRKVGINIVYFNEDSLNTESSLVDSQAHLHDLNKLRLSTTWDITTLWRFVGAMETIARFGRKHKYEPTVVDLGCSVSTLAHLYFNQYRGISTPMMKYIGVDWLAKRLLKTAECEFRTPSIYFQCDVTRLQLKKSVKPDVFIAMEIIEHFKKKAGIRMLKRMFSRLESGGEVYLTSPNTEGDVPQWPDVHVYEYGLDEIMQEMIKVGFRVTNCFGWNPDTRSCRKRINCNYDNVWDDLLGLLPTSIVSATLGSLCPDQCKGWIVKGVKP